MKPAKSANVTLRRVAEASGVSPTTVSRVVNGTVRVSLKKKAAVDRAIAQLGFVPDAIARALAGGRSQSVGVVAQNIDSPYYAVLLRGIEEELSEAGYSLVVASGHWDEAEERRCLETLRARRVDGIIVLGGRLDDASLLALGRTQPVVVAGRQLSGPGLYALHVDDFEGARLATRHLLDAGHRRIAFIAGDALHPDALERLRGYRAALAQAHVAFDPALVLPGDFREQGGLAATERLIASGVPFTAIFASNDQMAQGASLALYRHGLRVPGDVSLVGYDDLACAAHASPPTTTIHHAGPEHGRRAAQALLELLADRAPTVRWPAPRLVVRDSTRPLASAAAEVPRTTRA